MQRRGGHLALLIAESRWSGSQTRGDATQSMVRQLIERMIGDSDGPSTKEAETVIKNVATVTVEGMSRSLCHAIPGYLSLLMLHSITGASDTVH